MIGEPLRREFFERDPDVVAQDLLGSFIVVRADNSTQFARLVEVEAYGGLDDPASHAYRGPTPRSSIMFGPAGFLYVYRSYGVHWCINVVTEAEGTPTAVLLRAAEVYALSGAKLAPATPAVLLRGPGNLTRGLAITGLDNGADSCKRGARISFRAAPGGLPGFTVGRSRRIGISQAQERPSRYFMEHHPAVSITRPPPARA